MSRRASCERERGQVLVLFAVLLPVLFGLGAIVIDVGNWYVHKRHLQTQVDAAALAPAPQFVGCHLDATTANLAISQRALEYAGDTTRDPATTNLQVQQPNDVHVLLNSDVYWSGNPYPPDNTMDTDGDDFGDPCNERALDVKATDHDAPLLWGLIPLSASPKAKARVEIRQVRAHSGMLPWAVPEIDPASAVALFVNEDNGQVFDFQMLDQSDDDDLPWSEWATMSLQQEVTFDGLNQNTGIVILVSNDLENPETTGPLTDICGQKPATTRCYAGATATSGLAFVHGYSGGFNGSPADPQVRDVRLFESGCPVPPDHSAPYFVLTGDCSAQVQMVVDFGVPAGDNPTEFPYCAEIAGYTWSPGGTIQDADSLGTWTGSVSLPANSGRRTVSISGTSGAPPSPPGPNTCPTGHTTPNPNDPEPLNSFTRAKIAAPYVANLASGPIQYLKLTASFTDGTPVADPHSIQTQTYNYTVTLGLPRPFDVEEDYTADPILLRMASPSGSQNQAYDCDRGVNFNDEIANGCQTTYKVNYDDHDDDGDKEWRDITCAGYGPTNLPPDTFAPDPIPDCVITETGDKTGQLRDGLTARIGPNADNPNCVNTPNNWPQDDAELATFLSDSDLTNDPRYVTLIVTDDTAFTGSGNEPLPLKYFAGFYAIGWDFHPQQSPGCPDNAPHPILGSSYVHSRDDGDVWGYFVNVVVFSGSGDPSEDLCAFGEDPGICVAVLVE